MKIKAKEWIIFIILALVAVGIWYKLSYPQFLFVDFKITRQQALQKAESYLSQKGINASSYLKSIVFLEDYWADRYLQKALGFDKEERFIKRHDYELFTWAVRFFRENQKEEYVIKISPKSADILSVRHLIEDTEARQTKDKEASRNIAKTFLESRFKINFSEYDFHDETVKKFDNRTDYEFSWEKKDVYIPWGKQKDSGGAKFLIGAIVSGEEVRDFYRARIDIPEKFMRYTENQMLLGIYISSIFRFIFLGWIAWAIFIIINRKDVVIYRSRKYLFFVGGFMLIFSILYAINDFQGMLFAYPTSSFMATFIGLNFIEIIISYILLSTAVVMTGMAGESLRHEVYAENKFSSFFHYINSTIWSRSTAKTILFGYVVFFIVLGLQSAAFYIGQRYLGVWVERMRLTELSSSYIPFLSAFIVGYNASFSEEIIYRMFGLSWAKKYFKKTLLAVVITSLVWGFSHTQYAIFPVWFRGIEVTIMGIFFAFIFLKYGIIAAIVAHYLFDVFWGVANYILGNTTAYLFFSSVFIMAVPLILAIICFLLNRSEIERKPEPFLDANEKYNLEVLVAFLSEKKKDGVAAEALKKELISHGWNQMLVELAVKRVYFR